MGAFPFAPAPHGIRGNPSKCWRSFRQSEAKFLGSFSPYQTHKEHTKSQHVQPDKMQTASRQKCLATCLAMTLRKFPASDKIRESPRGLLSTNKFIRLDQVKLMTGLSKSTIYDWMAKGTFPKQISLGPRVVAWSEQAVETWIQSQIDASA